MLFRSLQFIDNENKNFIMNQFIPEDSKQNVPTLLNTKNTIQTSSMGRLFDIYAVICGYKDQVTFEGEAAIYLESLAITENHEDFFESLEVEVLLKTAINYKKYI